MELEDNTGESPVSAIRLFSGEGSDNCVAARPGEEQAFAAPIGHNESESHLMGLERTRTSEPSLPRIDEGRREPFEANCLKERKKRRLKQRFNALAGLAGVAYWEVYLREVERPCIMRCNPQPQVQARQTVRPGGLCKESESCIVVMKLLPIPQ